MTVSLVPFTTRLVGHYGDQEISLWPYGVNFILISLLRLVNWRYAASKGQLEHHTGDQLIGEATRKMLIGPLLYASGMALAFVDTRLGLGLFMLVPMLHLLPGPIHSTGRTERPEFPRAGHSA